MYLNGAVEHLVDGDELFLFKTHHSVNCSPNSISSTTREQLKIHLQKPFRPSEPSGSWRENGRRGKGRGF